MDRNRKNFCQMLDSDGVFSEFWIKGNTMRKKILFILLGAMTAGTTYGQMELAPSVLASAGGYGEGSSITLSWTLGELAVTTLSGNTMILTQGFQQPAIWGVGINRMESGTEISVFPNPVMDELNILFNTGLPGDFILEVQDVTGRMISQLQYGQVRPGDRVILNMSEYLSGIYFLQIRSSDGKQVHVSGLRKL